MKYFIFCFLVIVLPIKVNAQATRVAILDFENMSGIAKYDGLGKAMSSMLISDIESNVSPKRLQLVERAQIQKVLKEQSFQVSGSVDKSTAVQAGKILGVSYLLVGDVYILDDQLIINARLTNAETGDIVFSKKQEGKTVAWLTLKTIIAKELATSLSQPFIEPTIPDKEIPVATITTFGNAVAAKDSEDIELAEALSSTIADFSPGFKYIDDLRKEIDELKKEVEKNTKDINNLKIEVTDNVTDYLELGYKYSSENNLVNAEKYFLIGFNKADKTNILNYLNYLLALTKLYYDKGDFVNSIKYSNIGLNIYPYFKEFLYFKYMTYARQKRFEDFNQIIKTSNNIINIKGDSLIKSFFGKYSTENSIPDYHIEKFLESIESSYGEFYFNNNYAVSFNIIALNCIQEVYNEDPKQVISLLKQLDISKSSSEISFGIGWYTMLAGDFLKAQNQWNEIIINSFWRISDCADYGQTMQVKAGVNKNFVQNVRYVYDEKRGVVYQDSIRRHFPDGTIRSFEIPEGEKDAIKLDNPFWYYEYENGSGFVTLNPIEAFKFKVNFQYPFDAIIDCIKSSKCINWASVSESDKMAVINWGHSYLLSGEINKAKRIYQLFPFDFRFSDHFQNLTSAQVLNSDWSDFVRQELISKEIIDKMQNLVINNSD